MVNWVFKLVEEIVDRLMWLRTGAICQLFWWR